MVALNENFAHENPALGSKNRVGNFFGENTKSRRANRSQASGRAGKTAATTTKPRRVCSSTASDIYYMPDGTEFEVLDPNFTEPDDTPLLDWEELFGDDSDSGGETGPWSGNYVCNNRGTVVIEGRRQCSYSDCTRQGDPIRGEAPGNYELIGWAPCEGECEPSINVVISRPFRRIVIGDIEISEGGPEFSNN